MKCTYTGAILTTVFASAIFGQPLPDERREIPLFSRPATIPPKLQIRTGVSVHTNYQWARIAGSLQAAGGSGNDIRVMVLKDGIKVYDSGRERSVVLSVDAREPGEYVLVLDNTFSLVSPKAVSGTVSLFHSGVDTAKNAADTQQASADGKEAAHILRRLYDALKSDEAMWATNQLAGMPLIRIKNSPVINAGAEPAGNFIAVTRGAFDFVRSTSEPDDVLAAILGHELSHIFYRHRYGASLQGTSGFFDELRGVTSLDRMEEKEADLLGIRIACQAGFDPKGFLVLMDKFIELEPAAQNFMHNHPAPTERRGYLEVGVRQCLAAGR